MYLERGQKVPLHVKLWFLIVKSLTSLGIIGHAWKPGHPMLYSYQGALPAQPVPSVKDTLQRYDF